jgi:hypothetical protein
MQTKKIKTKKCKVCSTEFIPYMSTTVVCNNIQCAITEGKRRTKAQLAKRERSERKQTREAWLALQPKSYWLREAQTVFNKYIRKRDEGQPCISNDGTGSCSNQIHAGHFRSVGSAPMHRFNELNVNSQCARCNNWLSGNLINYRRNLEKKIGAEALEELEANHVPKHYTIDQIKEIIKTYKQKLKDLENGD